MHHVLLLTHARFHAMLQGYDGRKQQQAAWIGRSMSPARHLCPLLLGVDYLLQHAVACTRRQEVYGPGLLNASDTIWRET